MAGTLDTLIGAWIDEDEKVGPVSWYTLSTGSGSDELGTSTRASSGFSKLLLRTG